MGLLDHFSKKKTSEKYRQENNVSSGRFQGDLAGLFEKSAAQSVNNSTQITDMPTGTDSKDSVVYLSFVSARNTGWVCSECETRNNNSFNACVVCGLPR